MRGCEKQPGKISASCAWLSQRKRDPDEREDSREDTPFPNHTLSRTKKISFPTTGTDETAAKETASVTATIGASTQRSITSKS